MLATFTPAQIRQACALLGWRSTMLSRRARVSYQAAWRARQDDEVEAVSGSDLWAIRRALEAAGVEFIPEDGGGARLRQKRT